MSMAAIRPIGIALFAVCCAVAPAGASECPVRIVAHENDTVSFNGVVYPMHTDAQRFLIRHELERRLRRNRTCQVHLAGDPDISFKMVGRLIWIAQQAGVSKIGFLTEPRAVH